MSTNSAASGPTSNTASNPTSNIQPVDTTNCDQEPIHIPGFIQPHGLLFVLGESDLQVLQASDNLDEYLGQSAQQLLGRPLTEVLPASCTELLKLALAEGRIGSSPLYIFSTVLNGQSFYALAHHYDGLLILELEKDQQEDALSFQNLYALVSSAVSRLESAVGMGPLCQQAAQEIRQLTGLDKVMIYLFDEHWTGTVIGEARDESMEAYLGQRFPASDIPRQARELYLLNKVRIISDVYSRPVVIVPTANPVTRRSLNLTYSTLRSVSPIHIEYLKNMGVGASMSVSIVQEGRLAGLIACHHHTAKYLPYAVRTACEFLGQALASQLGAHQRTEERDQKLRHSALNAVLLDSMTRSEDYQQGLAMCATQLLELAGARGVALYSEESCLLLGETPEKDEVQGLAAWLTAQKQEVWSTDALPQQYPEAEQFVQRACGVLAISTSEIHQNFIIWFRPEVVKTIEWAGNPNKPVDPRTQKLHPRQSFEVWKELVSGQSAPWDESEIEAAAHLRSLIMGIVLRQAEERAQLSTELMRSNQELEAFSYSVSHDLRAPFRHILGFATMLEKRMGPETDETNQRYLNTIKDSALYAGTLVDNLLAFSRMGRSEMRMSPVDMSLLFAEIRNGLDAEIGERQVQWHIPELPIVRGDLAMLRLVVQNLLSNAVKYTRGRQPAIIEVTCREEENEWVFEVSDNGVGFDMKYANKLFGVFQRLHRAEEFEGTGIGLANTRRIITRHGGRTWAHGRIDEGATFGFSLPKIPLKPQAAEENYERTQAHPTG